MIRTLLPWVTTAFGAAIMYCAGRPRLRRAAWWLGVLNQLAWGSFAVITGTWGFLAGSFLYGFVYVRHLVRGEQ